MVPRELREIQDLRDLKARRVIQETQVQVVLRETRDHRELKE